MKGALGLIRKYASRLPVTARTPIVTLHEGGTPLVLAPRLCRAAGLPEGSVYLKIEGANPTGSFKDRGMTVAVSKALEAGSRGVLCASTGNTAASAAAYAARAGLRCVVLLPAGAVAAGKLSQSLAHGAEVVEIAGNFDAALSLAQNAALSEGWTLVNSTNPHRIQGQKTAAFEIVEQLGRAPDYQFMPVGNAGNITAYWLGYREFDKSRRSGLPRMMGYQAAGAAPIVLGRPIGEPKTLATAIRIGNPASWKQAEAARDESDGRIAAVTDREILSAYAFLAAREGVFCEPASAAGPAGLLKFARQGGFRRTQNLGRRAEGLGRRAPRDLRIVCILTGNGLKDPDSAARVARAPRRVAPRLSSIQKLLGRSR